MRSAPGDERRSRPALTDNASEIHPPALPQMSYVLADEAGLDDRARNAPPLSPHRRRNFSNSKGLSSRDDACRQSRPTSSKGSAGPAKHEESLLSRVESPQGITPNYSDVSLSQHMTPNLAGVSGPASVLSSASSRRNSLTAYSLDDSQVLSMPDVREDRNESSSMMDSGSAPQLVMPSIKMPSRRPFTEEGKAMGRLKVLVAGNSGIGKTALIKAIVQTCPHIVHVDPISPLSLSLLAETPSKQKSRRSSAKADTSTSQITEVYASTRPYPDWWAELDNVQVLKRRKSHGDSILDRNICFVDTPGYAAGSSPMDTISATLEYIESHFARIHSNTMSDSDTLNMVGGDGASQVDVVFYLIADALNPTDLEYLRRSSRLTNVIPLLGMADCMSPDDVARMKEQVQGQLREANIRTFSFASATQSTAQPGVPSEPYAISSATGSDDDVMDASILMSSEYIQPLAPSELERLVSLVFSQYGTSWLRHSAARKYIQWRGSDDASRPLALYRPLQAPDSMALASFQRFRPHPQAVSSFTLARLADHTQREEKLAQVHLAEWASKLQRSLAKERENYENLMNRERATWLTERLNECVKDGTLVPVHPAGRSPARRSRRQRGSRGLRSSRTVPHQDPLGLLEVAAELKRKGWVALEVLGSLSVLGGLALWLSRQYWPVQPQPSDWMAAAWSRV